MTRNLRAAAALLGFAAAALAPPAAGAGAADSVVLERAAAVADAPVPRLGLNLGGSSTWGAEQLMANALKNPGFEALAERSLVVVKRISGKVVDDDTAWLGRAEGYWSGGSFEVRTGRAAGRAGRVLASSRLGKDGPGTFLLEPFPADLAVGDALAVGVEAASLRVPLWWNGAGDVRATSADRRPGSPGGQAVRLVAADGSRSSLEHYLDAIGARAGKLLPLEGAWRLSFWARGGGRRDTLRVKLRREGSLAFFERAIALGGEWKHYAYAFAPQDQGPAGVLALSFEIEGGEALLDDVSLGPVRAGPGGFRAEVVELLRQLKPGYLRDWQGQLGDTLDNRLAPEFARRPVRYRPGEAERMYFYSLPQFLELCAAVGAAPWVVAPPLMGDADWRRLGGYLAQEAARHGFREILLEFGNENWNALFRPAGFTSAAMQAQAADRAFALVKAGAAPYRGIVTVVNAQYVDPASWKRLASLSQQAQRVAVAPYFLYALGRVSRAEAVAQAFAADAAPLRSGGEVVRAQGKAISVYEVNFHTTTGDADGALRNHAVSGAHSGAALARRLLQATLAGVREQAVYSLAGFDSYTDRRELVRLWGIARDLAPGQLRPTGLALDLLNRAYGGRAYASACYGSREACDALSAVWFQGDGSTRLAVVSAAASSVVVRTGLPCTRGYALQLLDGSDAAANNETAGTSAVRISAGKPSCRDGWQFELPAHSVAVLLEAGKHADAQR